MTAVSLIEAGFEHHQAGRLADAEAIYRTILATAPADLNALQLLGALLNDTGRADEATLLLESAVEQLHRGGAEQAGHAAIYHNLGNALLAQKKFDAAAEAYQTALRLAPGRADGLNRLGHAYAGANRTEAAIEAYRAAAAADPRGMDSRAALAAQLEKLERWDEAIQLLADLAADHPDDATILCALGRAHFSAKQPDPALACFERALDLRPDDADAHYAIGRIRYGEGDFEAAEVRYRRALDSDPHYAGARFSLGLLLQRERQQPAEAVKQFELLLQAAPDHVEVHRALGNAYHNLQQAEPAIAAYRRYLALEPESAAGHHDLGIVLGEAGKIDEAVAAFERAIELKPDYALAYVELGNIVQRLSGRDAAQPYFRRAIELEPVVRRAASKAVADFSVLLLIAPGAINTPYDYLVGRTHYAANFLMVLPGIDYDAAALRGNGDIVVNLISDVDRGRDILPAAATLIDRLGLPVINHPDKILPTDREGVATLLADIPFCRAARVSRHRGADLATPAFLASAELPALPFLVRRTGLHGGDDFEKVESLAEVAKFVSHKIDADYYVMNYLDYRSADGLFRKYRFFFVGEEILPYHLAIGDRWMVHHFRTDMANQPWMKVEEEAFLRDPTQVFTPRHYAALRTIRQTIGLEFFGIDCSIDRDGNLVMFEANATMLVHPHNHDFPYKTEYVRRIKAAFDAMLTRIALG